jgi:hypothetical protein
VPLATSSKIKSELRDRIARMAKITTIKVHLTKIMIASIMFMIRK